MRVVIDPRLVLHFAAIVRSGSVTAAARDLGVAQPWLSARVRRLEDQLGVELFDRRGRYLVPTSDGARLAELVAPLADASARVQRDVAAFRRGAGARVRIAVPMLGAPDPRQAELFASFAAAFPRIVLQVEPGSTAIHLDLVAAGMLDFVLTVDQPDPARFEALPLYPLALAGMMHADDPLAGRAPLTMADLRGRRLAITARGRGPAFHDRVFAPLIHAGASPILVSELRRSLLRRDPALIVATIVPAPAEASLRHGLVRRAIADAPRITLSLVRPRAGSLSRAADRFWTHAASGSSFPAHLAHADGTSPD